MSTLKVNNVQDLGADAVVTNGVVAKGALPSGSVLQVVSTTKTDTFSTTSTSFVDVTGYTISITPSSATSKILVSVTAQVANNPSVGYGFIRLMRDSTAISIGDASSNRTRASAHAATVANDGIVSNVVSILDSPNTTSSVTYKIQMACDRGSMTMFLNRSNSDFDGAAGTRTASTITVMEIAG